MVPTSQVGLVQIAYSLFALSRPGNVEYFKRLLWKYDLYGLERQTSLVAIKFTLSNFQNPRWQPSDLEFRLMYIFIAKLQTYENEK